MDDSNNDTGSSDIFPTKSASRNDILEIDQNMEMNSKDIKISTKQSENSEPTVAAPSSVTSKTTESRESKKEYIYTAIPSSFSNDCLPLMSIPDVALEKILSFLSYDQVAQMRVICKRMDWACQTHLNRGFRAAEHFHAKCLKDVRSKLPRRESSRREHPYSRHCDILTAIGTRISLLAMTFCKFIDIELSCFIPGKVIDEIFRVLRICNQKNPPRAFEVLQELRDISSMAMEHFDEKIVPTFRINPQNAIAGSASMISTCDLHGNSSVSPSKILSGSFMPIAGPSYLGVPAGISSPVFGTTHSTPKSRFHSYADKPVSVKRFDEKFPNKSTDNLHPAEKTFLDSINKSHQILEKTIKRQRRIMRKMQKEMNTQREKIEGLEKVVNSQETLIVNQTEKLKEHDNLFIELSKQSKEQIKIDVSSYEDKIINRPIKCKNFRSEKSSTYVPQFILQPPAIDPLVAGHQKKDECKEINSQVQSTKRKLPISNNDLSTECKRKRISEFEESDLSIIRCGALAAIANKKK